MCSQTMQAWSALSSSRSHILGNREQGWRQIIADVTRTCTVCQPVLLQSARLSPAVPLSIHSLASERHMVETLRDAAQHNFAAVSLYISVSCACFIAPLHFANVPLHAAVRQTLLKSFYTICRATETCTTARAQLCRLLPPACCQLLPAASGLQLQAAARGSCLGDVNGAAT
jgi:hypothetical protein